MSPTKKKLYLGALVIAVTGLMIDRVLIGEPAGADAAVTSEEIAVNDETSDATVSVQNPEPSKNKSKKGKKESSEDKSKTPRTLFPENLPAIQPGMGYRNPFQWPEKLALIRDQRLGGQGAVGTVESVRKPGEPLSKEEFLKVHVLNGVIRDGKGSVIIDNQIIEVGEKFDDAELLRISDDKAYFKCINGVCEICIAAPGDKDPS